MYIRSILLLLFICFVCNGPLAAQSPPDTFTIFNNRVPGKKTGGLRLVNVKAVSGLEIPLLRLIYEPLPSTKSKIEAGYLNFSNGNFDGLDSLIKPRISFINYPLEQVYGPGFYNERRIDTSIWRIIAQIQPASEDLDDIVFGAPELPRVTMVRFFDNPTRGHVLHAINGEHFGADFIALAGDTGVSNFRLSEVHANYFALQSFPFPAQFTLAGSKFKTAVFNVALNALPPGNGDGASFNKLTFWKSTFLSKYTLADLSVLAADTLEFDHNSFGPSGKLDLTGLRRYQVDAPVTIVFHSANDEPGHLTFDYVEFQLMFANGFSPREKERLYQSLLDQQKRDGFISGYEKLDKEYRHFLATEKGDWMTAIFDRINSWWWDYGYDRAKIFRHSCWIFLICLAINFFIFNKLIRVYFPNNLREFLTAAKARNARRMQAAGKPVNKVDLRLAMDMIVIRFVYTAFIFWGIKVDFKELRLEKKRYFLLITAEYVAGVICLAYIAGFVISR